jgi:hypothetical protein
MSTSTVVQQSWLTAAENASAIKEDRRLIVDTTNYRLIIHDGATTGGRPQASEAYVQAQIATLAAGNFQNLYLFQNTIYP